MDAERELMGEEIAADELADFGESEGGVPPEQRPAVKPGSLRKRRRPVRPTRAVPPAEAEFFAKLQAGDKAAHKRFQKQFGHLPGQVLAEIQYTGPDIEAEATDALRLAGQYFFPDRHPDFESWAETAIRQRVNRYVAELDLDDRIARIDPTDYYLRHLEVQHGQDAISRGRIMSASKGSGSNERAWQQDFTEFTEQHLGGFPDAFVKEFRKRITFFHRVTWAVHNIERRDREDRTGGPIDPVGGTVTFGELTSRQRLEIFRLIMQDLAAEED